MNRETNPLEEEARSASAATARLKRRMIVVLICMAVFAVIAIPLISFLDSLEMGGEAQETRDAPPSSIIFATPDYEYDIMKEQAYLSLNRRIYHHDVRTGVTEELTDRNLDSYGAAAAVLRSYINAVIMGDAEAHNALFSSHYFENHEPEPPFTMQRLYDITLTKVSETIVNGATGAYTQYEYEVEYKIRLNDGTFRTDIGHDESRKQYFVLSNSTSEEVLIDQIINYVYK